MNSILSIGLKLVAAIGVGVGVYFCADKIMSARSTKSSEGNSNTPPPPPYEDSNNNSCGGDCNNYSHPVESMEMSKAVNSGEKVVSGLKTAQDICGRAFSLCQNLAMAAENIVRVFKPGGYSMGYVNQPQQGYGGYNQCPNNGYQDKYKDPPGFRRISPYILEWVGVDNSNNQQMNNNYGYRGY